MVDIFIFKVTVQRGKAFYRLQEDPQGDSMGGGWGRSKRRGSEIRSQHWSLPRKKLQNKKQTREERTENKYKRKILYQYSYEKIHQDLVTGCMLMIRKKMSRMTYSFFQLNEYFHLSQTGIGQLRKDLEEKINEL